MTTTMPQSAADFDVVVVGAGAAGIAATKRLIEANLSAVMVEARDRLGGRSHTVASAAGVPLDLGCEWLHSADRNPWTPIARRLGFAIDEKLPDWGSRVAWMKGAAIDAEWQKVRDAFYERLDRAAEEPGDRAAATLLEPGNHWNALLGAISTWANGAELAQVSVKDYGRYDPTDINWRVLAGYGVLIARYGEGMPVKLETVVTRIDWGAQPLVVATSRGDLRARAVIVTVPTNLLAAEKLVFNPALPDKIAAAAGLPMHVVNKFFLRIDGGLDELVPDSNLVGKVDSVFTGAYQVKPHGWPVILAYIGGDCAAELERKGQAATADFTLGELSGLFGNDIKRRLTPLIGSAWGVEEFSRGAYSMALPGHADDRDVLAAPVAERLFFAGEACSSRDFGTAHAAYNTGAAAAEAAIATLCVSPGVFASSAAPPIQAGT
jgi:monoamine oxidase